MGDQRNPSAVPAAAGFPALDIQFEGLRLSERKDFQLTRLHLPLGSDHAASAALPAGANTASGHDPAWLCLRPGEWLALSEGQSGAKAAAPWAELADATGGAMLDHSDGHALFRLSGPAAPWLLSKVSSIDYLGNASAGSHCAQTRLGQIRVVVHARPTGAEGEPEFSLLVDRSLAAYAWGLLADAAPHAAELYRNFGAFGGGAGR